MLINACCVLTVHNILHKFDAHKGMASLKFTEYKVISDIAISFIVTGLASSHIRSSVQCRLRLKCDGTRAETIFRISAKRPVHLNRPPGASVQSTAGSRGVRISGSNAG